MDCSPPGSSVHGISPARILEWVAISFSRGSSRPRDRTQVSHIADRLFTTEPPGKSLCRLLLLIKQQGNKTQVFSQNSHHLDFSSFGNLSKSLIYTWFPDFVAASAAAKSLQSCRTLCDPMDSSPPGSSVHGISPARILEWVATSISRGSSRPRERIHNSCVGRQTFYH